MGLYADREETFRVELGADGWVEMRCKIEHGDRKRALAASRGRMEFGGQKGSRRQKGEITASTEFSEGAYTTALLCRMITAWSEPDPVTPENLERLPDTTVDLLLEELNERNIERTEEERADLSNGSTPGSEKSDPSTGAI